MDNLTKMKSDIFFFIICHSNLNNSVLLLNTNS